MINLATELVEPARYGWKAYYLSLLLKEGFLVPPALALAPNEEPDLGLIDPALAYAVRSSGLSEDSESSSFAGHFATRLEVRGRDNVLAAIEEVRASAAGEMPMAVVLQRMVGAPLISGVAFSVHPVTLARDVAVISWTRGLGDGLMSGSTQGVDLQVRVSDGAVLSGEWPLGARELSAITEAVIRLQDLLNRPIDVEWIIDVSRTLTLLQVRPIALPGPAVIELGTVDAFSSLPIGVASHSKLVLRAEATRLGVPMSRARAILATQPGGAPAVPTFFVGDHSSGRSVVLLHPARIEGKVVREFAKDCSTDVEFFVRGCQRYSIRQYPDDSGAAHSIAHILEVGLEHGVVACVIEQEILHAYATGILRRTDEGYLVEVALGHFVPKGYVETSLFELSHDLTVRIRNEVLQTSAYHFMNGHVIVESPPYEPLSIADTDLQRLVRAMLPILDDRPGVALEFGLLGYPKDELMPYMIDVADSDASTEAFTASNVSRGVVSPGTAAGRIIDLRGLGTQVDLDAHLFDAVYGDPDLEPAVYLAHRASLDLLRLVREAHPASGFVFERASLLAHLSVILRERGLAAVTLSASAIDTLVGSSTWLKINTAEGQMVVGQLEPEA